MKRYLNRVFGFTFSSNIKDTNSAEKKCEQHFYPEIFPNSRIINLENNFNKILNELRLISIFNPFLFFKNIE